MPIRKPREILFLRSPALFTALILFLSILSSHAYDAQVIKVVDGDTIHVLKKTGDLAPIKIRVFGIDCPERREPFYRKAKQFTADLVFRKTAKIEYRDTDRYGRTVAVVWIDGKDLGAELLKAGLAWWYRKYAPDRKDYGKLQRQARNSGVGIWSLPESVRGESFKRWRKRR